MDALHGFFNDDIDEQPRPAQVRPVSNPRRPADAGIGVLGLVMRTAGVAFALIAVTMGLSSLIAPIGTATVSLIALLSVGRSAAHAVAGGRLIEAGAEGVRAIDTYLMAAGLHTALVLVLVMVSHDVPLLVGALLVLGLMCWPALLAVLVRLPDARQAVQAAEQASHRLLAEDRGLTAIGVLMSLGGVLALAMSAAAILSVLLSGAMQLGFLAIMYFGIAGLFAARAWMGLRAGRVAVATRDPHQFHAAFARYHSLAGISLGVTAVAAFVMALIGGGIGGIFAVVLMAPVLLASHAWPSTLARYAERNLPEGTFSDERLPAIGRPRDAGLTGLGIVLLAFGLPTVVLGVGALVIGEGTLPEGIEAAELADLEALIAAAAALVAGWSLWHMTPRFQVAATVYGVIAGGLALWNGYEAYGLMTEIGSFAGPQLIVLTVLQTALALALPAATLWLALRHEEVGAEAGDADLARAFE